MNAGEFEREFDILYNNIMSNAAPSIDSYEKSVFLTKAQEEIVTAIYDGSFEHTEKAREYLDVLVTTEVLDSSESLDAQDPVLNSKKISSNSKFFALKNKPMFITYEALKLKGKDKCGNDVMVAVKPTKQDEYHRIVRNPFRKPRLREALRFNVEDMLEVVSIYQDYFYQVRYVRRPRPIILYYEPGLTIEGEDGSSYLDSNGNYSQAYTPCELDQMLHRIILDRAVQLAAAAYKQ